jgi:hypothetical protein
VIILIVAVLAFREPCGSGFYLMNTWSQRA